MQPRLRAASNPACPFAQYFSVELGKSSVHLHHHSSRRSARINRFGQAPEPGFSFLDPVDNATLT
jgi:hypothetical protein